jgi:hypothetical protein
LGFIDKNVAMLVFLQVSLDFRLRSAIILSITMVLFVGGCGGVSSLGPGALTLYLKSG